MPQPASVGCNALLHSDFVQIVHCGKAGLNRSHLPLDFVAVLDSARGNLVFRRRCTTSSIRRKTFGMGFFLFAPRNASPRKTVISFAFPLGRTRITVLHR